MKNLAIKVSNKHESEAVQQALFDMGFVLEHERDRDSLLNLYSGFIHAKVIYENSKEIKVMSLTALSYNFDIDTCCGIELTTGSSMDDALEILFSKFLSTYAGHIEKFPDYKKIIEATSCRDCVKFNDWTYSCSLEEISEEINPRQCPKFKKFKPGAPVEKSKADVVEEKVSAEELIKNSDTCDRWVTFPTDIKFKNQEPKFKVGGYLWHVDKFSIKSHQIPTTKHVNFERIDNNSEWFSTPELAAKRFLELNKTV